MVQSLHDIVMAATAVIVLCIVWAMVRVVNSAQNSLEWYHLISTPGRDARPYADWNKIGQGLGVILCVWLPAVYVYSPKMEAMGLAAVMGVALAYLGGVSGYAATLRSKQGAVETTKITEASPSVTVTEKKIETPPVATEAK